MEWVKTGKDEFGQPKVSDRLCKEKSKKIRKLKNQSLELLRRYVPNFST
jgi:hypothetical protein